MDVISERQPRRGAHCGIKDSLTLQTLEEVRDEAPESSPRRTAKKTNVGTQANSATEAEAETKFGGNSAMEIESFPQTKFAEVEASSEPRFGEDFAMKVKGPPEANLGEASEEETKSPLMTKSGDASATTTETTTDIEFGEPSAKEIQDPLEKNLIGNSAMELDTPPVKILYSRFVPGESTRGIFQEEMEGKEDPLSQIVSGSSKQVVPSKEKEEEEQEEPMELRLSQSDNNTITEGKAITGEPSSSAALDPNSILIDGSSSAPLDLKLSLKKESSSASLDSKRPPRKESSSGSLDSKLPPCVMRRRNRVSVTMLERMQQDPLLAEHFAQLETPTAEPISEFSSHGFEQRRSLKSTSRLKCTTDSVGIKYMNQYIVIKVLGRGTFGKVKLCLNTMDCKLYAVKILYRKWVARRSIGSARDDVGCYA